MSASELERQAEALARAAQPRAIRAARWCWEHPAIVLLAALALVMAGWMRACDRADRAEAAAAHAAQEAQVRAQGIAVVEAVKQEGLARRIATAEDEQRKATGRASTLEEQVHALLAASSGAHVIEITHGDTGWVPSAGGGASTGPAPEPGGGGPPSSNPAPPGRVCLFFEGDEGRVLTADAKAKYSAGVIGVVGTADAYGRAPGGLGHFLFGGPLQLEDLQVDGLPAGDRPAPRYGFGARAQCVAGGCAAGLASAWQPYRHLEVKADVSFLGAAAAKGAGADVLVRF